MLTIASSSTRMFVSVSSARANDTSCFCPWLRFDPSQCVSIVIVHLPWEASSLPPSYTLASSPPVMRAT